MNDIMISFGRVIPSRFCSQCAICGRDFMKRNMTAIYTKDGYASVKVLCHVCQNCLPKLLDFLAVSMQ